MLEDIAKWIGSGAWLPAAGNVVRAIVIVSVALLATHLLHLWLGRLRRHARGSDASRIIYVVQKIGGYIIIVAGSLAALSTLGLNLQSFSVFAGALGVGVGLGLQGIVRDEVPDLLAYIDQLRAALRASEELHYA